METQEIFDRVVQHLRQQGRPALNTKGSCSMYRADNGLMCAVGCLIKEEFYTEELEFHEASEPTVVEAINNSLGCTLSEEQLDLLSSLQNLHDDTTRQQPISEIGLKEIAKEHNLTYETLD